MQTKMLLHLTTAFVVLLQITAKNVEVKKESNAACMLDIRVCNRPEYCTEGEVIPEPNICNQFYLCIYGFWELYTCALGSYFDTDTCECVLGDEPTCDYNCAVTTTPVPDIPGPCVEAPCTNGDRTADREDCEDFWECVDNEWQQRNCLAGVIDDCTEVGFACVYDVQSKICIHPTSFFRCHPRCLEHVEEDGQKDQQFASAAKDEYFTCLGSESVCDRPAYCNSSVSAELVADPDNCTIYYECVYFEWMARICSLGTYYDPESCGCVLDDTVCFSDTCPETTVSPTLAPDTCEEVEDPCPVGKRYPDQSHCEYYYECQVATSPPVRRQCGIPSGCPPDNQAGGACVFDIYALQCTRPNSDFDCELRCLTTQVPTTEATVQTMAPTTEATVQTMAPTTEATVQTMAPTTEATVEETTAAVEDNSTTGTTTVSTTTPAGGTGGQMEPWAVAVTVLVTGGGIVLIIIIIMVVIRKSSKTAPESQDEKKEMIENTEKSSSSTISLQVDRQEGTTAQQQQDLEEVEL